MPDVDAEEFAAAAAAARATEEELHRLRAENAELRVDAERWAHIAGIARGALQQIVARVPVTSRWHNVVRQIVEDTERQIQGGESGG